MRLTMYGSEFINSWAGLITAIAALLSAIAALRVAINPRPRNKTRRKEGSVDTRSNRRFSFIFIVVGVALILISGWIFCVRASTEIVAVLEGVGSISPSKCTIESPCSGLTRGSTLSIKLKTKGYASAYLQAWGSFYNQEGRLAITNSTEGDLRLWPAVSDDLPHTLFRLYIVTSDKAIPTFNDSDPRKEIPDGKQWGPIYLKQ